MRGLLRENGGSWAIIRYSLPVVNCAFVYGRFAATSVAYASTTCVMLMFSG